MKKILYLFLLFLPVLGVAQSRYGVEGVPMCWTTALGVDSSIIRYVLVSTTGQPVKTIVHENANGVVVNISGGTLRYGFCDCAGGALDSLENGSVTWEKLANPVKDSINKSVTWSRLAGPVKDSIRIGMNQKRDTSINFFGNYNLSTAVGDDAIRRRYRKITLSGDGPGSKVVLTLPDGGLNMTDVDVVVAAASDTIQVQAAVNDGIYAEFRKVNPARVNEYKCIQIGAGVVWKGSVWDSLGVGGQAKIQFKDEGSNLGSSGTVTDVNVTGPGATASRSGNTVTIDVPGGGGGSAAPYTFVVVSAGQSNAHGAAEDRGAGTDTTQNARVRVFDYTDNRWKVARVGFSPVSGTIGTQAYTPTHWFYFAKKWAVENPNDTIKIIPTWADATAISGWFNGTTRGPQTDTIINRVGRSGVTKLDLFIWDQGESDAGTSQNFYNAAWDSIKATLRRRVWWTPTAPLVCVGMPRADQGSTASQAADVFLRAFDYNNDILDGYATSDSADVNFPGNNVHFNSRGLYTLGNAIYNAWKALPNRYYDKSNPGGVVAGSTINPGVVNVVFNSAAGGGATTDGVTIRNTASTGISGVRLSSPDNSTTKGFFGIAGQSGNYLGSNVTVLGTETNSNLIIFRNFVKQMEFGSSAIDFPVKVNFTAAQLPNVVNTTANSGPGFTFTGAGSNFVNFQLSNGSSALPNSFAVYVNNGFKTIYGSGGTIVQDSGAVGSVVARSVLDIRGSVSYRVDSIGPNVKTTLGYRNNILLARTGSSIDTVFLPSPSSVIYRKYTIRKTDAGSGRVDVIPGGSVKINGFTGVFQLTNARPLLELISNGVDWYTISDPTYSIPATANLDFPNTTTGNFSDLTITIIGAIDGDIVSPPGVPHALRSVAGTDYRAWVSSTNTITVRFINNSGADIDPASANFKVNVIK